MGQQIELIEKKDWEYSLYKKGNIYELVIPLATPSPGFDVLHVLNEAESAGYESDGIVALTERLADMRTNLGNYQHQSWR